MLNHLIVLHIPERLGRKSRDSKDEQALYIKTCLRQIYIHYSERPFEINDHEIEIYKGKNAYQFLLETICGLKSRLQGESEIKSQFKQSYAHYLENPRRHPQILRVMQKLFQDAKRIRTQYLKNIGQNTYAGLSRKFLSEKGDSSKVLLLGSGQLAQELVLVLKKRFEVSLSARNPHKVQSLCSQFDLPDVDWLDYRQYLQFSQIVVAVHAPQVLFDDSQFFQHWQNNFPKQKIFIDLSSPSICQTQLRLEQGFYSLTDVLADSEKRDLKRLQQIQSAKMAITSLAAKRMNLMPVKRPANQFRELKYV